MVRLIVSDIIMHQSKSQGKEVSRRHPLSAEADCRRFL